MILLSRSRQKIPGLACIVLRDLAVTLTTPRPWDQLNPFGQIFYSKSEIVKPTIELCLVTATDLDTCAKLFLPTSTTAFSRGIP